MIAIKNTLVSDEVITEKFVCHIEACKAACCVEGDMGAPLEEAEASFLEANLEKIKPFIEEAGWKAIQEQGAWVIDEEGEKSTPTVEGRECAYVRITENGTLSCGIENAFNAGVLDFRKPVSCHLYPVRVKEHSQFTAVNYHRWHICQPACELGQKLGTPVYVFLKDALVRRFGADWYAELEACAGFLEVERTK